MKWFIIFVGAALFYLGFAILQEAAAGGKPDYNCFHCTINQYEGDLVEVTEEYITEEYYVEETNNYTITQGLTDDELAEGIAGLMSVAAIDFTSTTNKWQLGIGAGGYDGVEALSIGVGKVLDSESFGDVLFTFKATRANNHTPWGGALIWKIP